MAVTQVAFDIPQAIQEAIDAGILLRFGGVVRDTAGHIVKHLDEVSIPEATNGVGESTVIQFTKKNKCFIIGTAIAVVAAGVIYVVAKNKRNKEEKVPKCVADFNISFSEYVDSIKKGTVSKEKIDKVIAAMEDIRRSQEKEVLSITFSVENIGLLLGMIRDYTIKFAEANSFEIQKDDAKQYDEIEGLQHYLKIQKQIFEKCV